jgi:dihydrofolate synthase/folylpolyglutamate synthase
LDVAHNPAGAWALRSTLSNVYEDSANNREITMVFGAMRDKAIREIGEILFPISSHVILTSANNPRAATAEEIRDAAARVAAGTDLQEAEDVAAGLAKAKKLARSNGLVVITGSIYIVGEAMRILGIRI